MLVTRLSPGRARAVKSARAACRFGEFQARVHLEGFQIAGSRCGWVIFVNQSIEQVTAFDSAGRRSPDRCCCFGQVQRERAVRALGF
jgi:hypothetical protein